jgi:hypothetical protein
MAQNTLLPEPLKTTNTNLQFEDYLPFSWKASFLMTQPRRPDGREVAPPFTSTTPAPTPAPHSPIDTSVLAAEAALQSSHERAPSLARRPLPLAQPPAPLLAAERLSTRRPTHPRLNSMKILMSPQFQ